jgi:hypothetical protein
VSGVVPIAVDAMLIAAGGSDGINITTTTPITPSPPSPPDVIWQAVKICGEWQACRLVVGGWVATSF